MNQRLTAAAALLLFAFLAPGCSHEAASPNTSSASTVSAPTAAAAATPCPCGPDVCLNDARYPPKLAQKKAALKATKQFPDELIALLDRDGHCVMAIDQAPDSFRILLVAKNGKDSRSIEWTQKDEEIARKEVKNGDIKEFYKFNVRKVFACCGEPKAEDRPDFDSNLNLSRGLAIACTNQGGTVVCK